MDLLDYIRGDHPTLPLKEVVKANPYHDELGRFTFAPKGKLYHVTYTDKVESIKEKGLLPFQTTNWVQAGSGDRYGEGQIFAFENRKDAIRWALNWDWKANTASGSGKFSLIELTAPEEWEIDTADPLGQAMAAGKWLKRYKNVPPEGIGLAEAITEKHIHEIINKFDPDQPRYPKGHPDGGQWAAMGTGSSPEVLFDALDNARSPEEVKAALQKAGAGKVHHGDDLTDSLYVYDDYVIEWDETSQYATVTKKDEWIWQVDPTKYYPNEEQDFNDGFWAYPFPLYHYTQDDEDVKAIAREGLLPMNITRGIGNRGVGAAVFTTSNQYEYDLGSYGDVQYKIDTAAMVKDKFTPWVSEEPDILTNRLREAVAHKVLLDDFSAETFDGQSPYTIIVHDGIPAKYLSRIGFLKGVGIGGKYNSPPKVRKYDPDQPRYPKGDPRGGQWASLNPDQGSLFPTEDDAHMLAYQRQVAADVKEQRTYPGVVDDELDRREEELWGEGWDETEMTQEDWDITYAAAEENLKESLSDAEVRIAVGGEPVLKQILDDGRVKTQFEVGASRGIYDPDYRRSSEHDLFGIGRGPYDYDSPPLADQARPVYGYISRAHDTAYIDSTNRRVIENYGRIQLVLDTKVRRRTTVTGNDSLTKAYGGLVKYQPSRLNSPKLASFIPPTSYGGGDAGFKITAMSGLKKDRVNVARVRDIVGGSYMEAQVHGGVSVSDIAKIRVPRARPWWVPELSVSSKRGPQQNLSKETLKKLKDLGIKVEYYGEGHENEVF